MRIQLESQGFDVTPPIRGHVDDQLAFHLSSFSAHVNAVNVYLSDINGPRGGPDKRVVIDVSLARGTDPRGPLRGRDAGVAAGGPRRAPHARAGAANGATRDARDALTVALSVATQGYYRDIAIVS